MSLIKIPFKIANLKESEVDYESLGITPPEDEYEDEQFVDFWIRAEQIIMFRNNLDEKGSLVDVGGEFMWTSSLEPEEIADLINGTITIKH